MDVTPPAAPAEVVYVVDTTGVEGYDVVFRQASTHQRFGDTAVFTGIASTGAQQLPALPLACPHSSSARACAFCRDNSSSVWRSWKSSVRSASVRVPCLFFCPRLSKRRCWADERRKRLPNFPAARSRRCPLNPTLSDYVLVLQEAPIIEHCIRRAAGSWSYYVYQ